MSINRLLIANRGEIAIRIHRASADLGIRSIAIYSHEDRYSLHRFKANEAYPLGGCVTQRPAAKQPWVGRTPRAEHVTWTSRRRLRNIFESQPPKQCLGCRRSRRD